MQGETQKEKELNPILKIQKLIKAGNFDRAIEIAQEEYKKKQDDKIYNLYGIALFKKGEFQKASDVFGELYAKYPDNLNILMNYAKALICAEKIEDAERNLREAAMLFIEDEKAQEKILALINEIELIKSGIKSVEEIRREIAAVKKEGSEDKKETGEEEKAKEEVEELIEKIEEVREELETSEIQEEVQEEIKEEGIEEAEKIEEIEKPQEEIEAISTDEEIIPPEESEKEKETEIDAESLRKILSGEESISFEEKADKKGILRRGRILEISLQGDSEIVLRETFVIFISGSYRVFPLYERENGKIKKTFFGGKEHKFIKIRGEDALITTQAEYISVSEISSEEGELLIIEPFLVGFEPSISYETKKEKIAGIKKVKLVELSGDGKVIFFTGGRKLMWKDVKGRCRISISNFVGVLGEAEIRFEGDSAEIKGVGKALLRI